MPNEDEQFVKSVKVEQRHRFNNLIGRLLMVINHDGLLQLVDSCNYNFLLGDLKSVQVYKEEIHTWFEDFFNPHPLKQANISFERSKWFDFFNKLLSLPQTKKTDVCEYVYSLLIEFVFKYIGDEQQLNELVLFQQEFPLTLQNVTLDLERTVTSYTDAYNLRENELQPYFEKNNIFVQRQMAYHFACLAKQIAVDKLKEKSSNLAALTAQPAASAGKQVAVQQPVQAVDHQAYLPETELALYAYIRMQCVFQAHPPVFAIHKKYDIESKLFIRRFVRFYPLADTLYRLVQSTLFDPKYNYYLKDLNELISTNCPKNVVAMNELMLATAIRRFKYSKWMKADVGDRKYDNSLLRHQKFLINDSLFKEHGGLAGEYGRSVVVMMVLSDKSPEFFMLIRCLFVIKSKTNSDDIQNREGYYAPVLNRAETQAAFKIRVDAFIEGIKFFRSDRQFESDARYAAYPKEQLILIQKLFYVDKKEAEAVQLVTQLLKADYEGTEEAVALIKASPDKVFVDGAHVDGIIVKYFLKGLNNLKLALAYIDFTLEYWNESALQPEQELFNRFISELDNPDKELIKKGRGQFFQKQGKHFIAHTRRKYGAGHPLVHLHYLLEGEKEQESGSDIPLYFDFPSDNSAQVEQFVGALIDQWRQKKTAHPYGNRIKSIFELYYISRNQIHLPIIHKKIKEDPGVYNSIEFYQYFFQGFPAHYDSSEWNEMLKEFVKYIGTGREDKEEVQKLLNVLFDPDWFEGKMALPGINKFFLVKTLHSITHRFKNYMVYIEGELLYGVVDLLKATGNKPSLAVLLQCARTLAFLQQGGLLKEYGDEKVGHAAQAYIKQCAEPPANDYQKLAQCLLVMDLRPRPDDAIDPDIIVVKRLKERDLGFAIDYIRVVLIGQKLQTQQSLAHDGLAQAMGFASGQEVLMHLQLKEFQEQLIQHRKAPNAAADQQEASLALLLISCVKQCHIKALIDPHIGEWLDYLAVKIMQQPDKLSCRNALRTFYQNGCGDGFPSYFHLDSRLEMTTTESNKLVVMRIRLSLLRDYIEFAQDRAAALARHKELLDSIVQELPFKEVVAHEKEQLVILLERTKDRSAAAGPVGAASIGLSMFGVPSKPPHQSRAPEQTDIHVKGL